MRISRWKVVVFWVIVIFIFFAIYFFRPGWIDQMRQSTYQETPFVNTPNQG